MTGANRNVPDGNRTDLGRLLAKRRQVPRNLAEPEGRSSLRRYSRGNELVGLSALQHLAVELTDTRTRIYNSAIASFSCVTVPIWQWTPTTRRSLYSRSAQHHT